MTQEEKTSRERYLEEKENIIKSNSEATADLSDEEIEDVKEEVDKSMGEVKHTLTKEQYVKNKNDEEVNKAIESIKSLKSLGKHVNEEETALLQEVFSSKPEDPVLKHLVRQRALQQAKYDKDKAAVKELTHKIQIDIAKASSELVKVKGAIESIDRQILEHIEENPDLG